jgi:hypothetical protein
VVERRVGEVYGGVEMREEMLLEEMKILMKLVEEVLQFEDAGELDEEGRRTIEEKVWEVVKKLMERYVVV